MEGVLGPVAARLDANVRVVRGTALVPGTVNTSSQADSYVALPAAANGVFAGVAAEDFFETGFAFASGTDPSTVNGTTPAAPYNLDRKSTRLNSSHGYISYAVFCLKKKKKQDKYRLHLHHSSTRG